MNYLKRGTALLLAATVAVSSIAADDLPELGEVASGDLSLAMEKKIGQSIMHEIRWRDPAYFDDPDVESYLNRLGSQLVAASNDPGMEFYFFPINDPSINAFAMPGGYIGVHTGLLLAAQSESELAGVLAHEVSHVTQRHIARQIMQSKQLGMASMLAIGLALLAARSSGQVAGAAVATSQAGAISAQLAFSRDFEREADRVGFETLRKAGFDVRGMAAFFERLQKASRIQENKATAYLRTHPLSGERMADMQNREQSLPYQQVADSIDFQLVRARIRAQGGVAVDAERDFRNLLEDRKYASEAAVRYGLSVALQRKGDFAAAERELQAVKRLKVVSPILDRHGAELRLGLGDAAGALAAYREAMVRYPLNTALIYGYGQALLRLKRYSESLRFAEQQLQTYSDDIRLHKMRAESYAGLGKRAQQHMALAEVFALQGQLPVAIEQLSLAQRAGDANFYEMSVIDSRLRELKQRHAEELKERRR